MSEIHLGAEVMSKATGFPATGFVYAFCHPGIYTQMILGGDIHRTNWTKIYPDWPTKLVCQVVFKKPQKPLTYAEFLASPDVVDRKLTDEENKEWYESVPETQIVVYPIDDLELFE